MLGYAWAAPNAYIANTGDDTVSVVDTATNTVVTTINVGNEPGGTAVSPDGNRVYVANRASNTISVIDTTTNTVIATISDSNLDRPRGLVVNPTNTRM